MKKYKSIVVFTFAMLVLLGLSMVAYADEESQFNEKEFYNIMDELSKENHFEIIDFDSIPKENVLHFESIEEAVKFVNLIGDKQVFSETISISNKVSHIRKTHLLEDSSSVARSSVYDDSHRIKWWSPFAGFGLNSVFCWRNISFEYTYDFLDGNPRFLSISNIDSYLSGLVGTWWQSKTTDYDIVTGVNFNDKVILNIKGNYVLGIAVKGFAVGAVVPGEWEASLRLR